MGPFLGKETVVGTCVTFIFNHDPFELPIRAHLAWLKVDGRRCFLWQAMPEPVVCNTPFAAMRKGVF